MRFENYKIDIAAATRPFDEVPNRGALTRVGWDADQSAMAEQGVRLDDLLTGHKRFGDYCVKPITIHQKRSPSESLWNSLLETREAARGIMERQAIFESVARDRHSIWKKRKPFVPVNQRT